MSFTQTKLKIIITGTGRCGTLYISKLLSFCNIFCGHETIFDHSSWNQILQRIYGNEELKLSKIAKTNYGDYLKNNIIVGDSSYMAMPYLDMNIFNDCFFIHVIRNPIDVINSFCHNMNYFYDEPYYNLDEFNIKYLNFIYKHVPDIKKYKNPYERAACFYLYWNDQIEKKLKNKNKIKIKIEEIGIKKDLENFLNFNIPKEFSMLDNNIKENINKFNIKYIKNKKIKEDIISFCEKHEYNY
jgi:hypothetical protein